MQIPKPQASKRKRVISAEVGIPHFHRPHHHHKGDAEDKFRIPKETPIESLYPSGNVQKLDNIQAFRHLPIETCRKPVELSVRNGEPCPKQVFADEEVAENTCRALASLGITGEVYRCQKCRLIHVREYR